MSKIVAETKRLFLKEFSVNDIDGFFELNNDPIVLQYTGDSAFKNKAEVALFISEYDQYRLYGFGRWSVYLKYTGQYIGFSGLRYLQENKEIDIGFRINRKFLGKGYATESAVIALDMVFKKYKSEKIIARTMKDNSASHSVIRKLGMQYHSEFEQQGKVWVKYSLSKIQWLS